MSDKVEDILYQAHSEGIWKEVMETSKSLDTNGKSYYSIGDKFEEAYNIVKTKKKKSYESKHLDTKRRSTQR
jgi:hypothetical protein